MVQRLRVRLPSNIRQELIDRQTDRIQIFLSDISNSTARTSNRVPFIFKDIDFCSPLPADTDNIDTGSDSDLEDAYQECLDAIADFFCEPVQTTGGEASSVSNAKIESFIEKDPPDVYSSGGDITLQWKISGEGTYKISTIIDEEIVNETDSLTISDSVLQEEIFSIPSDLSSGTQITYSLRIEYPPDGQQRSEYLQEITIRTTLTEQPPAGYLDLGFDNDVSDAKKELYTLAFANNLLDTTIEDWNTVDGNTGSLFPDDKLREKLGCFYIKNQSNDTISFVRELTQQQTDDLPEIEATLINQNGLIGLKYQEKFQGSPDLSDYLQGLNYVDLTYEYQKPYTTKEASRVETPYNSLLLDIKTDYNYYLKEYEEVHTNLQESLLPNMYFIELNKEAQDSRERDLNLLGSRDIITAYNLEVEPYINSILQLNDTLANVLPDRSEPLRIGDYYSYFLERYPNRKLSKAALVNSSKTIVIPLSFYDKLENYNSKREDYPFYNQISFSFSEEILQGRRDSDETIATILKYRTPNFAIPFMMQCMYPFIDDQGDELQNLVKQEYDLGGNRLFSSPNRFIKLNDPDNPYLYFNAYGLEYLNKSKPENEFLFLDNYLHLRNIDRYKIDDQKDIFGQILLPNYIKTRFRTYTNILEGKKAYRETLFYRIAKFRSSDLIGKQETEIATMSALQNIIVAKDPDRNDFTYLDTQVKYGQKYAYRIYSYDLVAANEIVNTGNNNPVTLDNKLGLYLVENLYDAINCVVVDKPPLYPQVDFNFYKDVDNRILISLANNSIEGEAQPVLIKEEDAQIFAKTRESQLLEGDEPISFGGDDTIKTYQVLRTTFPPKSYQDFDDGDLFEISTRAGPESQTRYASIVHLDEVEPNKKYYYTFRCIDIHDQLSNPTEVYEFEMINESGTIYPVLNVWQFPRAVGTEQTKKVKKLIMIQPQFFQQNLDLNIAEETDINTIKNKLVENIGKNIDKKIWGKTYKMRIVSKHTNKVYDIKFKFDKNGEIIT